MIITEKDAFGLYLTTALKSNGQPYKKSTIKSYSNAIALITSDLVEFLNMEIESLFDITDVKYLRKLKTKLYSIDAVKKADEKGQKKDSNAFQRYIEFRGYEQGDINAGENGYDECEARNEGGLKIFISKVYERDKKLRAASIKFHKAVCFACKFDFKRVYGEQGDGFIEIHHVKPLMFNNGNVIKTNPKTDLFPLCSNCHRMVHRKRNVVLSIEALKKIIEENRKK